MTFRVKDGISVNGIQFVDTSTNARALSATITSTADSSGINTGALQVTGGGSLGGSLFVAGVVTATSFVGAFAGTVSGTATSANNLTGGTAGQFPYQTAPGSTSFVSTSSMYVASAVTAEKWRTPRTFTFGGDLSGSMVVDGSQDVTFTATIAADSIALGTDTTGNYVSGISAGTAIAVAGSGAENATVTITNLGVGSLTGGGGVTVSASTGSVTLGFTTSTLVTTASNLAGGSAGQFAYQTAAGQTAFVSTGSMYVYRATQADSAAGQAGSVANALTIGSGLSGGSFDGSSAVTITNLGVTGLTAGTGIATNGSTGSLTLTNVGVTGLTGGGGVTVSASTGSITLGFTTSTLVTTASNLAGGTAGQLAYQSAAGTTAFAGPGTAGQLLMSAGTSAPTYTNTASIYVDSAVKAETLRAGTAGAIVYQSAADTSAFLALSGTQKSLLTAGASAPVYVTQVQAQSGTGSATGATGQSLVVTSGGLGVTGDSYFANKLATGGTLAINDTSANTGTNTSNSLYTAGGAWVDKSLVVSGDSIFRGNVTFNGTSTFVYSTQTIYTDNILNLHIPPGGVDSQWTLDDGKDIGFRFHYYTASTDTNAALVLANDTKYLEWYSSGAEGTSTFAGSSYGTFKTGSIKLASGTGNAGNTSTGALTVLGGVGVSGGLYVGGTVTATSFVGAFAGTVSGTATSANNLTGGTAGQVPYQTGAGATSFYGPGTAGQILVSAGTSAPTYTNTASIYVGNTVNAEKWATARTVSFSGGDVTGSFNIDGSANVSNVALTIAADSVALGTDTTGNYVATATAGTGISVAGSGSETAAITITNLGVTGLTGGTGIATNGSTGSVTLTNVGVTSLTAGGGVTVSASTGSITLGFTTSTLVQTASNIAGGTAGQLHYQSAAGTTAFTGPGTAGQVLVSNGTSAPAYQNTLTLAGTTVSSSTTTGALVVAGGAGIGGDLNVGGTITVGTGAAVLGSTGDLTLTATGGNVTTTNIVVISNTAGVTSAATGALRVAGGVGVGGGVFVGGTVTATSFVGAFAGTVSGNADTASKWATPRTFTFGGDLSGSMVVDGSQNVTFTATIAADSVALGTDTTGNYVATAAAGTGIAVAGSGSETAAITITNLGVTSLAGTAPIAVSASTGSVTVSLTTASTYVANAVNAEKWLTARTITLGGDLTGSVSIDGSAGVTLNATIAADSVALGTDTTGNYVGGISAGTAIAVAGSGAENATVTITNLGVASLTAGGGVTVSASTGSVTLGFTTSTLVTTASNLAGGSAGQFAYQSAAGTTAFASTSSMYVNSAVFAEDLRGGTAGQLVYQSAANTTDFVGPGTAGQLLMSAGASAPVYTSTSSIYVNRAVTADNLVGGSSISGNLTVTGNLTVQGTTVTVNSTVTSVADPIITIGGGANGAAPTTDDGKDRGIAFQWHNGTAAKVGFFGFDDSTGYLAFVPDATITNEVVSGSFGDIQATNFRGALVGNADTATSAGKWTTARTITLGGDLTGSVSIDGSAGVTLNATIAADSVALGTDTTGNYVGGISAGTAIAVAGSGAENATVTITNLGVTSLAGTAPIAVSASTGSVTVSLTTASTYVANAVNAEKWLTARTITLGGDLTGSVSIDGSAGVTLNATIAADSVALGTDTTGNYVGGISAGTAIAVSGSGAENATVTITNLGVSSLTGTANRVTVSASTGSVTLNLPQDFSTTASVQLGSLGIGTAASGTSGEIRATNEITAYYSDRRLKENVKVIDNAVTKVLSLNGITYTPNELAESFGYDRTVKLVGLFADEVEAVLPEATRPAPFDQDENGNSKSGENYKTIQYEKLVPLLIEAIKEQQQQIAQLYNVINNMANK